MTVQDASSAHTTDQDSRLSIKMRIQRRLTLLQQTEQSQEREGDNKSTTSGNTTATMAAVDAALANSDVRADEVMNAEPSIFNLFGIAGIGKSRFIYQLFDAFSSDYPVIVLSFAHRSVGDSRVAPEQHVALPTLGDQPLKSDESDEFTHSWNEVIPELRRHVPGLSTLPDEIILTRGGLHPLDEKVLIYKTAQLDLVRSRPILLLLDGLDKLTYWKWMQEEIIKPLFDQQQGVVVCTSQSPIYWHFWELREGCEPLNLTTFNLSETKRFLEYRQKDFLAQTCYAVTDGYMLGLNALVEVLDHGLFDEPKEQPNFNTLSDVTRLVLYYTGILRYAHVNVMLDLLKQFAPDWSPRPQRTLRMQVLPELYRGGLFRDTQSMRLMESVHAAVDMHMRQENPRQYLEMCQYLEQWYASTALSKPILETESFNEWLYFSTTLLELGAVSSKTWRSKLHEIITRVKLGGNKASVLFAKDKELQDKLQRAGCLTILIQTLREHIKDDGREPLFIGIQYEQYQQYVLAQLTSMVPSIKVSQDKTVKTMELLQAIHELGDNFNSSQLRSQLRKKDGEDYKAGPVNNMIAVLHSLGMVTFDDTQQIYSLNTVLRSLVPG